MYEHIQLYIYDWCESQLLHTMNLIICHSQFGSAMDTLYVYSTLEKKNESGCNLFSHTSNKTIINKHYDKQSVLNVKYLRIVPA